MSNPFSISLNPMDFFTDKGDRQVRRQWSASEQQRQSDNEFRNRSYAENKRQFQQIFHANQNRVQNLVKDARAAGVSPLAAMGAGGSSPMNISMPVGQGGRVSGNYSRNSAFQLKLQASTGRLSEAQANKAEWQALRERNAYKKEMLELEDIINRVDENLKLYIPTVDNTDQARSWYEKGILPMVNPDLNLEAPETFGAYYHLSPRVGKSEGNLNK